MLVDQLLGGAGDVEVGDQVRARFGGRGEIYDDL